MQLKGERVNLALQFQGDVVHHDTDSRRLSGHIASALTEQRENRKCLPCPREHTSSHEAPLHKVPQSSQSATTWGPISLWRHVTFTTPPCGALSALELYSYTPTHLTTYRHTQNIVVGLFQILKIKMLLSGSSRKT